MLVIDEPSRRHLEKVLRLAPGAAVTYTDGAGRSGEGTLDPAGIVRGAERIDPESVNEVIMAVCPPKDSARVRFVVEKLAELGVDRLWWLLTQRTEGRPPPKDKARSWAISALEQSRGSRLLRTSGQVTLTELSAHDNVLVAVPGGPPLAEFAVTGPVVVCIGPEGGFATQELFPGVRHVGLGSRVLRVETAAVVAATLLVASPFRRR